MSREQTYVVFNATGGSNRTTWQRFANWYDDLAAVIFAAMVCEADGFWDVLRHLGHLSVSDGTHGEREVAVVTHRKPRRQRFRRLTRFIPRPGSPKPLLWHDRWLALVTIGRGWGRVVIISGHVLAVIQDRTAKDGRLLDNDGAREWRTVGLPKLEGRLRGLMARNVRVRYAADMNQHPGTVPENPAQMFDRLGMEWVNDLAMWFAWNPRRDELVHYEVLPTPPGSDGHRTLVVTLRRIPLHRRVRAALTTRSPR